MSRLLQGQEFGFASSLPLALCMISNLLREPSMLDILNNFHHRLVFHQIHILLFHSL